MDSSAWALLKVAGDVDLSRIEELTNLVDSTCNSQCPDTVADLSEVTFMDSTGLGWLLRSRDLFHEKGRRFAVILPPSLDRLFEVSGLIDAFEIHRSIESVNLDPPE